MQRNKTPLHGEMEHITVGEGETTQKITLAEIEGLHAEKHGVFFEDELFSGEMAE